MTRHDQPSHYLSEHFDRDSEAPLRHVSAHARPEWVGAAWIGFIYFVLALALVAVLVTVVVS